MTVEIEIVGATKESELIDLLEMHSYPYGTVFQEYMDGKPVNDYWICCGSCEKRLVNLWFDDESGVYRLSTDRKKDLREFRSGIKAMVIDAEINLTLKIKK